MYRPVGLYSLPSHLLKNAALSSFLPSAFITINPNPTLSAFFPARTPNGLCMVEKALFSSQDHASLFSLSPGSDFCPLFLKLLLNPNQPFFYLESERKDMALFFSPLFNSVTWVYTPPFFAFFRDIQATTSYFFFQFPGPEKVEKNTRFLYSQIR